MLLIEHNLDVIKLADWIIDMGPEAGDGGGQVVAMGRPEEVAAVTASHTGRWLGPVLAARPLALAVHGSDGTVEGSHRASAGSMEVGSR